MKATILELLSLVAGLLTMLAPGLQSVKIIRTRNTHGLSIATCLLQSMNGALLTLVAVEYGIFTLLAVNVIGLLMSLALLWLVSWRTFAALMVALGTLALGLQIFDASLVHTLLTTTHWANVVTTIYGVVATVTFLPQVWMTHRTRDVSAISLPTYASLALGLACWTALASLIGNVPLIITDAIITIAVLEVLRLKLTTPTALAGPIVAEPNAAPSKA